MINSEFKKKKKTSVCTELDTHLASLNSIKLKICTKKDVCSFKKKNCNNNNNPDA